MGFLFRHRKNKRFSYKPRFYEMDESWHDHETRHRFEEFKKNMDDKRSKRSNSADRLRERHQNDIKRMRRIFLLVAILVVLVLYFFDFDFSLFTSGN